MSLFTGNANAIGNTSQTPDITMYDFGTGVVVPVEITKEVFSDEIDLNTLEDFQFERSITFEGDSVGIDITLTIGSLSFPLEFEGTMYRSSRYTDEQPVYVGAFDETDGANNAFNIVYFEVSNDDSPYNLQLGLRDLPSITMYLRDQKGNVYDIGNELSVGVNLDSVIDQAPVDNDINWFLNIVQGEYNEVTQYSPQSMYDRTWSGSTHTLTFRIADYEHYYQAIPYIDFSYGDVPYAGITPFSMSLKINESARYRRVGDTAWTSNTGNYSKCFFIDNAQLTWTAGGNTRIAVVAPHLNITNGGSGTFNFTGLAAAVAGILPQTATLATILSIADPILGSTTGSSTPFTNTKDGGSLQKTAAYKMKFPANYYISESGKGLDNTRAEGFEYIANMATENSNLTRGYSTYAVADFKFKISWADIEGHSGSKPYEGNKYFSYKTNY